jgi:hypothetical protein
MINKLKIENAGDIVIPAGKLLLLSMKERKHIVERPVPVRVSETSTVEDEGEDPINEMKIIKNKEPYYIQFYKVLSVNNGETDYEVGDIVLGGQMIGIQFDLIPKTRVVNKFDIIAKYVGK